MLMAVIMCSLVSQFVTERVRGPVLVPYPFKRHPQWVEANTTSKIPLKGRLVVVIFGVKALTCCEYVCWSFKAKFEYHYLKASEMALCTIS